MTSEEQYFMTMRDKAFRNLRNVGMTAFGLILGISIEITLIICLRNPIFWFLWPPTCFGIVTLIYYIGKWIADIRFAQRSLLALYQPRPQHRVIEEL